jgi:hypothetical protein
LLSSGSDIALEFPWSTAHSWRWDLYLPGRWIWRWRIIFPPHNRLHCSWSMVANLFGSSYLWFWLTTIAPWIVLPVHGLIERLLHALGDPGVVLFLGTSRASWRSWGVQQGEASFLGWPGAFRRKLQLKEGVLAPLLRRLP